MPVSDITFGSITDGTSYEALLFSLHAEYVDDKSHSKVVISLAPWRCSSNLKSILDSKVHWAYMGPTWGRQDLGGPHIGPMIIDVWVRYIQAHFP